jgi:hypothetical protein
MFRKRTGAHWKKANNLNTGDNDAFFVGSGNLSDGHSRIKTGVTYVYQSPMPLEFEEYNGETNDLHASINASYYDGRAHCDFGQL